MRILVSIHMMSPYKYSNFSCHFFDRQKVKKQMRYNQSNRILIIFEGWDEIKHQTC